MTSGVSVPTARSPRTLLWAVETQLRTDGSTTENERDVQKGGHHRGPV